MYAIYGNIYHQYTPNVSIYTIHWSYGYGYVPCFRSEIPTKKYSWIPQHIYHQLQICINYDSVKQSNIQDVCIHIHTNYQLSSAIYIYIYIYTYIHTYIYKYIWYVYIHICVYISKSSHGFPADLRSSPGLPGPSDSAVRRWVELEDRTCRRFGNSMEIGWWSLDVGQNGRPRGPQMLV